MNPGVILEPALVNLDLSHPNSTLCTLEYAIVTYIPWHKDGIELYDDWLCLVAIIEHVLECIHVFVSFKHVKCNNAYRFLRKIENRQCHSHIVHRDYPRNPKGKNQLRASTFSFFLHCIIPTTYNTI